MESDRDGAGTGSALNPEDNWQTCVTFVFAELGIADLLHGQARPLEDLARATGTDRSALGRFLRCAAALGFVTCTARSDEGEAMAYALTAFGALLRSDHPMSQRAAARLNGAPYRYQPWGHLLQILRSGSAVGFSPSAERGTLAYLADKPELLEVFHRAMTDLSAGQNRAIARAYDFRAFTHVVDLGGGEGSFLDAVLEAHPHLRGTLFDLPDAPASEGAAAGHPRRRRCGGDFFVSVPATGDVYTMKNVVHNWPEPKVLQLLSTVREAMRCTASTPSPPEHKRLLIIEHLVTDDDQPNVAKWLDLNFMVLVDGRERRLHEYRALGAQAGFELLRTLPTPAGRHLMEFALAAGGAGAGFGS
jgi:hypothetical protein